MITTDQMEQCKAALLERQNELIPHVEDHFGNSLEAVKESMSELSNYDNHPGDFGTELYEREKDIALNDHAEKELEEINEALHAIDQGTYGICSKCGEDIPFERLMAVPTTDRCVEHAADNTFEHSRTVEEEVFSPNINPDEVTDEEQVNYDAEDSWQDVSRYGTSESPSDFYEDKENYEDMFPNSEENTAEAEDLEGWLSADIDGNYAGPSYHHNKYEEEQDRRDS
ncbi:TraR/DksA C4-type zinc finger protein [Virgibacillus sediminis]|uniref:TraR/DksA C4-type zinc finger protein n=1 Tax=Virgibacillus sediminis TaxID=202260 RepID=A0ABV7A462_9BACI